MTYDEAVKYIHSLASSGAKPDMERTKRLLHLMGDPQKKTQFVHIAGTNGKGSCAAMLYSILRAAGYSTGLFTSPYIHVFNERIGANGEMVSDAELAEITDFTKSKAEELGEAVGEFEFVTAVAFQYFARKRCRIVVLETGLGGRLDPTNVIEAPLCAVITNIGLDHTALLGGTPEKIASEKAGIIKAGCGGVAVYQPEDDGVFSVFAAKCRKEGVSLRFAEFDELELLHDDIDGQVFCYCDDEPLELSLLGSHQLKNAATVLEAVEILRENGLKISIDAVKDGLKTAKWPARFELVSEKPYVVVDGGHNPQCAESLAENLEYYFPDSKRVVLLGMMRDKDVESFCSAIAPVADAFVCTAPSLPRAMPPAELAEIVKKYNKPAFVCADIKEAAETALRLAGRDGMVCATGSLYIVGDVRAYFGLENV